MKYHTMLQALFKYTGLEETFKDICKDRKIGTRKARDIENQRSMKY